MAGENTLFPFKILKCLEEEYTSEMYRFKTSTFFNYGRFKGYTTNVWDQIFPKIHTIREDKSGRWKPGTKINFVINNRSKDRYQFAPVIPCVSVQPIKMTRFSDLIEVVIGDSLWKAQINSKGVPYSWDIQLQILAQNDGFDSVEDFFAWFNKDYSGKIIHWTKYTY